MFITKNSKSGITGGVIVTALAFAGITAGIAPANAVVVDTDRPRLTARHFDYGLHWTINAPRDGARMEWDVDSENTVSTEGYLYLTDRECGRIHIDYYDSSGGFIDHQSSAVQCAPGNGKTQWWKSFSFTDNEVMQARVSVQRRNSNGSFTTMDSEDEELN